MYSLIYVLRLNIYYKQFFSKEHKKLLRQKYIGIVGTPKWAKISEDQPKKISSDGEEEEFDLLKVNVT